MIASTLKLSLISTIAQQLEQNRGPPSIERLAEEMKARALPLTEAGRAPRQCYLMISGKASAMSLSMDLLLFNERVLTLHGECTGSVKATATVRTQLLL